MSKTEARKLTSEERAALAVQVKRVRQDRGMLQQELAEAAGVARQTVSNLERGTVPQEDKLRRILNVLGIRPTPSAFSEDTEMWLGIFGGVLESLPAERRNTAGQRAFQALTEELAETARLATLGSKWVAANPEQVTHEGIVTLGSSRSKRNAPGTEQTDDLARAARKRSADRGEEPDSI